MKRNKTWGLAFGGMIAALYTVLTYFAAILNLASGAIQVRFSEALTILPVFSPWAIPGLTLGCFLGNLTIGSPAMDLWLGPVATLIGAIGTRLLKKFPYLAWIPPVLSNAIIVPFILREAYAVGDAWWYLALTVGAGEVIACGVLGILLYLSLKKTPLLKNGQL